MVWPMIIAAGAQIAGTAIKSAQARRAKRLRDNPRGQANAAFGANYGDAQQKAQQAAEDASMHQQLSLAKSGSGTLGSQASAGQMAAQRAPSSAAQAQLAAARVGEGFAHGANEYMGTTMAGNSAGMDAQAGAENQMIDSAGIGAQMLSAAFGGGGGGGAPDPNSFTQSELTANSMPQRELPPVVSDDQIDPATGTVIGSDIRMKQSIQPLDGMPSREVRGMPHQRLAANSDADLSRFRDDVMARSQRAMADSAHTGGIARPGQVSPDASVHPSQMRDGDFITPVRASDFTQQSIAKTMGMDYNGPASHAGLLDSDARSKQQIQALSSQNQQLRERLGVLSGRAPGGMQVTTQEEAAMGSVQEMTPPHGATRSYSYSVDQSGNQGSAFGPSGDREMQGAPAGLPAHNPHPQDQATNRPAGALRHQSPFGGVDLRGMAPEAQAQFQMQNPDFTNEGGVFTRQGAPGTSGMGGPPGEQSPPTQAYYDPSGQFTGEFAPWVQDKQAARDLSTGGALRHRPTNYNDQPNAYSNRIKFDAGGFQRGQGYNQAFDTSESYRQMIRDGKITGMVRVPILDFTKKVGLERLDKRSRETPSWATQMLDNRPRPNAAMIDNSDDPGLETLGAEKGLARETASAGQANSDAVRQELAFREEMRAKNAAAKPRPRAPGGAPALANVPASEAPLGPPATGEKIRNIMTGPGGYWAQAFGGSEGAPPPMRVSPKDSLTGGSSEPPANEEYQPYSMEEMSDFVINEFMKLNPGAHGLRPNDRLTLDDLDEETAAKVKDKTNEFMLKQEEEMRRFYDSDKRGKGKASKVSAAEVFEKTPGYSYEYKAGTDGAAKRPGKQVGIMAQDLEKTPAGKTVVHSDERGMKKVDTAALTMMQSAALNEIQKRLKKLEGSRA